MIKITGICVKVSYLQLTIGDQQGKEGKKSSEKAHRRHDPTEQLKSEEDIYTGR